MHVYNAAFIAARAALETYWTNSKFEEEIARKSLILAAEFRLIANEFPNLGPTVRGRGLMYGLAFQKHHTLPVQISREALRRGLVIETCGGRNEVLKFLAALTIAEADLRRGLSIVRDSIGAVHDSMETNPP
ncbi:aminotransferase class III-fold pyridoxal phosphate-dependent enzyme [Mesorhizobium newzealandense]|uniref:Aminotransferase class III-fold pyridoxal phosphate-dependent enzyme n=1 Tax=Mesorhizobium newzealandense TaxID=1300302 RepID=A0ABW4UAC6_9HYPH